MSVHKDIPGLRSCARELGGWRRRATIPGVQDALTIVIFAVVGAAAVAAVVSLFVRSGSYDQVGRGGLSLDRDVAPRRDPAPPPSAGERDAEIRQMLAARNARRVARGEAPLDVDAELGALTRPTADPGLREEVRALVQARNARRLARGESPLDVEAEVERRLRELAG
jgi:hypothetical protein